MIIAESELVNVSLSPLGTDRMMRAIYRAFKLAPKPFDGVGVDFAAHVFFLPVVHLAMLVAPLRSVAIDRQFIRVERGGNVHVAGDVCKDVIGRHSVHHFGDDLAAPLYNADDRSFASGPASAFAGARAADVGFIRLDNACELWRFAVCHQLADLVIHPPRGLVGDAKLALQFLRSDTVLAGRHQEDGKEPRGKRRGRLVEDRASGRVNLLAAICARIAAPSGDVMPRAFLPAVFALATVGPAGFKHKIEAGLIVGELGLELS